MDDEIREVRIDPGIHYMQIAAENKDEEYAFEDSKAEIYITSLIFQGLNSGGAAKCLECPEGYISGDKSPDCQKCPVGTESNSQNTECIPCKQGYFNNEAGN